MAVQSEWTWRFGSMDILRRHERGRDAAAKRLFPWRVPRPLLFLLFILLSLSLSLFRFPVCQILFARTHNRERLNGRSLLCLERRTSRQATALSAVNDHFVWRPKDEGSVDFTRSFSRSSSSTRKYPSLPLFFFLFSFLAKKPGLFTISFFLRRERKQQTQVADIGEPQTLWGFEWRPVYVKNSTKMRWWFPRRQTHTNRYSKGDRKRKTQTLIIWEIECKEDEEEEETGEAVECRRNAICCSNDARFSRSSRGVSLLPSSSSS